MRPVTHGSAMALLVVSAAVTTLASTWSYASEPTSLSPVEVFADPAESVVADPAVTFEVSGRSSEGEFDPVPEPAVRDFANPAEEIELGAPKIELETRPIEDLATRVAQLERIIQQSNAAADVNKATMGGKGPDDGWLDLSTETWNIRMGGHVQIDYINWLNASPSIEDDSDYVELRRLRLVADGTGYGIFDFRLQLTLEPSTIGEDPNNLAPEVKDAYLSMNEIPWVGRFRVGNFFVPFGLEQVTNDTQNVFLERSIPTQGIFTADREVGVACYNINAAQNLQWSYGAFFDSVSEGIKEKIDDNMGYRLAGRLVYIPYYDEPSGGRYVVHTGIGVMHTEDGDGRTRFRTRPEIHEGPRLIDSGVLLVDTFTTSNVEFAVVWGRLTVQSEAYLCHLNLIGEDVATLNGNYIHASYFVTGEHREYERFGQHGAQFFRPNIFTNFFLVPGGHGWGALELKARWSRLDLGSVDAGQLNDFTLGFNWYWSDRIRWMFDYIHPITTSETVFGATNSDIAGVRVDWNW